MNFKNMTDSELAEVMVSYITRIEHLQHIISQHIERGIRDVIPAEKIKNEYRQLKYELREDAHYLELHQNRNGSDIYKSAFSPSIREAAAFGFTVPVNSTINFTMYSAVEEAHYKLTKIYNLEEWAALT
ncbi:MAG: hypothetical protein ACI4YB_08500 [Oscillospiraceae bacterium]